MGARTMFDPVPGVSGVLDRIFDEINEVVQCSLVFTDSRFGCKISDLTWWLILGS